MLVLHDLVGILCKLLDALFCAHARAWATYTVDQRTLACDINSDNS